MSKLKLLNTTQYQNGFTLTQVIRNKKACIYLKSKGADRTPNFEVVWPRRRHNSKGEYVETYPKSEDWGIRGWTYMSLEDAEQRFKTLV